MTKRVALLIILGLFITGCTKEPDRLSFDDIEDLKPSEQVQSIIDNTKLVDEFEVVIDDNSAAVIYPADKVHDSTLVLSDKKESFPYVAMTFVEHLKVLDFDEVVITSYEPSDVDGMTGLTRVSAMFTKETIKDLDFDRWKGERENRPVKFYRYADAYLIRGNVWDKLNDETKDKVSNDSKKSDSQFWDHYGSYVE